ncbi:hypothetical protein FNF28_06491 [Cafeteria roenbergensis]|uniref:Ubiquitin carboxyl-terminal hydrolase n=1 Tax=Cafeteria roenbergensis TaxID=33653 RepID=A0A5A8CX68_CAFRO|nr:hypothetical protein FNF28_06491 [Cafeteria roenbergensis]
MSQASAVGAIADVFIGAVEPPSDATAVHKSECAFSFVTPEDEGGLYLNMRTFTAVSEEFLVADAGGEDRTAAYLHMRSTKKAKTTKAAAELTKMAIGVEGGAPTEAVEWEHHYALVVMPGARRVELTGLLPHPELSDKVNMFISRLIEHDDASKQAEVKASSWEFKAATSAFAADLPVVERPPKISPDPSTWKCAMCDMRENLWLNLSTGLIGCGRRQWDGSGGNSHALEMFNETGKQYPLCVKLGTITAEGADVFSYHPSEDDLVVDPHLGEHLQRFGIDVMKLRKTDKSMAQLQLELNNSYEFDRIEEAGVTLTPASGAGLIGLKNLGNSCYVNSCLQILAAMPEFRARYLPHAAAIFSSIPARTAAEDVTAQVAKLAVALGTDKYVPAEAREGLPPLVPGASAEEAKAHREAAERLASIAYVAPSMLRNLLGRGHAAFSTMQQQDAEEYWGHLLDRLQREEQRQRASGAPGCDSLASTGGHLGALFEFEEETRLQCTTSATVRYTTGPARSIVLPIPEERATNKAEVEAAKAAGAAAASSEDAGAAGSVAKTARTGEGEGDAGSSSRAAAAAASAAAAPAGSAPQEVPLKVPFEACLEAMAADAFVPDLVSGATGKAEPHTKRTRFARFPPYLMLQMRRYTVGDDWQPKKVTAEVVVPEMLDISALRAGGGLQPGETAMPAAAATDAAASAAAAPEPDAGIVEQLMMLGLGSDNACKRAALAVDNANAEVAAGWLMEHMGDADINDPIAAPASAGGAAADEPPAALVETICAMGFEPAQAKRALRATDLDPERAVEWLFSHAGDEDNSPEQAPVTMEWAGRDGDGKYELFGIISHLGKNTGGGHYVAHVKKNGTWCIFNDRKVALSHSPPFGLGYLYFFRRLDAPGSLSDEPGKPRAVQPTCPVNAE